MLSLRRDASSDFDATGVGPFRAHAARSGQRALNLRIGLSNQHGDSSNLCAMERCTLPDLYPTQAPKPDTGGEKRA
jgi:hypothetical protein